MSHELRLVGVGLEHGRGTPWAHRALTGIDLAIAPGERVLVVGTNGSGKSTLAWILGGLLRPTEGMATMGSVAIADRKAEIGLLVQHARLQLLRPTVNEEMKAFCDDGGARLEALARMGFSVSDVWRRIDDLSIGQQRRIALAAQLARRSPVLVLDEPMAGLDRRARAALVEAVAALPASTTVVTVTHDLADSAPLGDQVVELRDGTLITDGAAS